MYSRNHAIISVLVGALASLALPLPFAPWVAVGYAVIVGVGIDFDHFLVTRLTTGEWTAVRRCLRNPRLILFDQESIFEPGELTELQRLLSHHVLGGLAVALLWLVSEPVALFTAIVLYAHVLADLYADNRRQYDVSEQRTQSTDSADISS